MSYLCKLTGRVSCIDHKGRNLGSVKLHKLVRLREIVTQIRYEDEHGDTHVKTRTRLGIKEEVPIHPEVYSQYVSGARTLDELERLEPNLVGYFPKTYEELYPDPPKKAVGPKE